jgi:hypothetical protein
LALQPVETVTVLELSGFETQSAGELGDGAGFGDRGQLIGALDERVTLGAVEPAGG